MRRRPHTLPALSLAGALLVAGLGAGCGGGGGDGADAEPAGRQEEDRFCTGARALYTHFAQANVTDPAGPEARRVFAEAEQLDPPAEIADVWDQSLALLEPLVAGEIDVHDPAQVAQLGARAAEIDGERLETYFAEECPIDAAGSDAATSTTATPTTAAAG